MRILHIWDQAGVACVFAKYQQSQGHDSKVIIGEGLDKYGIYRFYERYIETAKSKEFIERCIQEASSADIIHVHSMYHLVSKLRIKFGSQKKIILHYHGTDLRGSKNKIVYSAGLRNLALGILARGYLLLLSRSRQKKAHSLADAVLVAARDLLRYVENGKYIPLPVDTDHFKPNISNESEKYEALTIENSRIDMQMALDHLKKHNIKQRIEVYDRTKKPVMYVDMPRFLKKYKLYVDVRFVDGKILNQLSTTAVQSLACGLKVLDYELKYRLGLPPEFEGKNVVSKLV